MKIRLIIRTILGVITYPIIIIILMFYVGGDVNWIPGWFFLILYLGMLFAALIPLLQNKKLLEERVKPPFQKGQDFVDKIIIFLIGVLYLVWLVVMPLDYRFNLSPEFPIWLVIFGIVGYIAADILFYFVFKQNQYLIAVVKKQENHKVVSSGLYGVIRHPLYMAAILLTFSGAIVLSSLSGIYVSILITLVFYIRTIFEEKKLKKELDGYEEYTKKVKFRLIPFLF